MKVAVVVGGGGGGGCDIPPSLYPKGSVLSIENGMNIYKYVS